MKRAAILLLVSIASIGASWAAFQALAPEPPPLSRYVPAGSLLYLQARDFSALLADWNASSEKASWAKSKNYEVYSRSRLFLRLQGASQQFAAAAGLPPDMNFLTQVAGTRSALALYDIGKLEFLYITKLPSASSMQSTLWQTRTKFETFGAIPNPNVKWLSPSTANTCSSPRARISSPARSNSWLAARTVPSKPSNGGPNPWQPGALRAICGWSSI